MLSKFFLFCCGAACPAGSVFVGISPFIYGGQGCSGRAAVSQRRGRKRGLRKEGDREGEREGGGEQQGARGELAGSITRCEQGKVRARET